jgi:hypothetical protein
MAQSYASRHETTETTACRAGKPIQTTPAKRQRASTIFRNAGSYALRNAARKRSATAGAIDVIPGRARDHTTAHGAERNCWHG